MEGRTVVVTGASGFIASQLVKDLLERGYHVRGTVRNPDDVSKVGFLLDLPGAKERLTLYKADLVEEGSFDAVVDGSDGVFHTASPVVIANVTDPEAQLINPAVKGTLNLLQSVAKAKSVKRVVLTSSFGSVGYNAIPRTATTVIDESSWSDEEYIRRTQQWYVLSKTLAEKAAWDFVKETNIDLVSVNPVYVLGKLLQPTVNASGEIIVGYIKGNRGKVPNFAGGMVDVKDVSTAHILAFETPEAEGRYLVCAEVAHHRKLVAILHNLCPEHPVVTELAYDEADEVPVFEISNAKAVKLGVKFRPLEAQLKDMVDSLKERGVLPIVPQA